MKQLNVRIGKSPHNGEQETTINGITKSLWKTVQLYDRMRAAGEGNTLKYQGDVYTITKVVTENGMIIADAVVVEE